MLDTARSMCHIPLHSTPLDKSLEPITKTTLGVVISAPPLPLPKNWGGERKGRAIPDLAKVVNVNAFGDRL